jgi:gas vesicle protein
VKKESKLALGALVATGAGFVAGVLTAPRSGWRTRQKLAKSASKARVDGEKQLKQLHSDLQNLIKDGEVKLKTSKATKEFKKQLENSKKTKQKVKLLISAIHGGEATDPDLKKMLEEAKKAKSNLSQFLKK